MRLIFILAAISGALSVQGQHNRIVQEPADTARNIRYWQLSYFSGFVAPTHTTVVDAIESKPFSALDLKFGVNGRNKPWHALHHYPTYGLGVGKIWLRPLDNIVGNPVTTYLFYEEPLYRFRHSAVSFELKMGLASNWKAYDQVNNPDQKVIGSSVTGYGGVRINYTYKINSRMDFNLGVGLDHFSNGRMRSPNRGLNLPGVQASIRYHLNPLPSFQQQNHVALKLQLPVRYEVYAVGSLGMVSTFEEMNFRNFYRLAGSLSLDVARHYSPKGKYGLGLDWTYDESLKVLYKNDYPSGQVPFHVLNWHGIHGSHEYMIHRWSVVTQAGINLKQVGDKGAWYGRLGVRYDLSQSVFVRLGLRVYGSVVSDFIEWGVGYSWYSYR